MSKIFNGRVFNRHKDLHHIGSKKFLMAGIPIEDSDLRSLNPPIYDQLDFGSCTAQTWRRLIEYREMRKNPNGVYIPLSSAMFYDCERIQDGDFGQDAGSTGATGAVVATKVGICRETLCPYTQSDLTTLPTAEMYADAKNHIVPDTMLIDDGDIDTMIAVLSQQRIPIGFGIVAFPGIMNPVDNTIPYPGAYETPVGGHEITLVGFDSKRDCFIMANSWGTDWGMAGYAYISRKYVENTDLSSDFHTVPTDG